MGVFRRGDDSGDSRGRGGGGSGRRARVAGGVSGVEQSPGLSGATAAASRNGSKIPKCLSVYPPWSVGPTWLVVVHHPKEKQ